MDTEIKENKSYYTNLKTNWYTAYCMLLGCIMLLINGVFPSFFKNRGNRMIKELYFSILKNELPVKKFVFSENFK